MLRQMWSFSDADLLGLTAEHVYHLLLPVTSGEADMTISILKKEGLPLIWLKDGTSSFRQRALKFSHWNRLIWM